MTEATELEAARHLARFREMETQPLRLLDAADLTPAAQAALSQVLSERASETAVVDSTGATAEHETKEKPGPVGARGGLAVFLTVLCMSPIATIAVSWIGFQRLEESHPELVALARWTYYKYAFLSVSATLIVICLSAAIGMARSRRRRAVVYGQSAVVACMLGAVLVEAILPVLMLGGKPYGPGVRTVVAATAWFMYLSTSKRVRATYTED